MSTSDAAELELRVGGGESPTPRLTTARLTRTITPRGQQNGIFDGELKQENHLGDETQTQQESERSAIRHEAVIFGVDREREEEDTSYCYDPKIQTQNPDRCRFTSSISLRLSIKTDFDQAELKLKKEPDPCPYSLAGPQRAEERSYQVNGGTSPAGTSVETASDLPLSEKIPFSDEKEERLVTVSCNTLETTPDSHVTHGFLNGHGGPHVARVPHRPQPRRTFFEAVGSEEDIKDYTRFEDQNQPVVLYDSTATMLSSTMVSVLTPPWGGRLPWTKRVEATCNLEAQGNKQLQESYNHLGVEKGLRDESQEQLRSQFMGTRGNTVGWSTNNRPPVPDFEHKRNVPQSVSLDVNSGRLDNRIIDEGAFSPVAAPASPLSPCSLNPHEQKGKLQRSRDALSPLSSKPTTSSILLSSRRLNSNCKNSNINPSKINPLSLTSSTSDQGGKLFMPQFSQSCFNNNGQEKPLLSPSSISYRTRETSALFSPPSSNQREGGLSKSPILSTSPLNKERADTLFSQQPHTVQRAQSYLSHPRQTLLTKEPSEGEENCRGADKKENQLSESSVLSPAHTPYDRSAFLKKQSLPRRTTLLSTSSWKQVTQEGSTPTLNDITNNKYTANTLSTMNVAMKTEEGAHTHRRNNADDSPGQGSSQFLKQQCYSNLHAKEPQSLQTLPGVLSIPKLSTAKPLTKLTSTLGNPNSPNTLVECSQLNNNYRITRTSTSPTSPHGNRDSQKFAKQTFSTDATNTVNSQALSSKIVPPNTNTSSSFSSHPVSSQTSTSASFLSGCPPETLPPKFTNRVTTTPLGFERSYASIPKPFHPKAVSSLIPTAHAVSNYGPVFTTATTLTPSSTTGGHAGITSLSRPSLLTPPSTPVATFSSTTCTPSCLLTPPATPVITTPTEVSERDSPKPQPKGEVKKVRRVTWEDSMDHQQSEATTVEKTDPSQVPTNPPYSRPTKNTGATSIFSFLRSGSPTADITSTPKTSGIQVWRGEKPRSLSSDFTDQVSIEGRRAQIRPSDSSLQLTFDQKGRDTTPTGQERMLSVEANPTAYCRTCAPLSLPPDFSNGYKLRYSSPPYSTLISTRLTQGETKNATPRSTLLQETSSPPKSKYTLHLSMQTDTVAGLTSPTSKFPPSPISSLRPLSQPSQNKTGLPESSKCGASEIDRVNNNHCGGQDQQNGRIILVDNRVHVSSESLPLQSHKAPNSLPTCVTETLVYRISKADSTAAQNNTTPKPLSQHTTKKQVSVESHTSQTKEVVNNAHNLPNQSPSGSGTNEGQCPDDQCNNKIMKEIVVGRSTFYSVQSNNEQSPKRSRFALKRSGSTPNSTVSANKELSLDKAKSETERAIKPSNKMDQVLNRLKQTFSSKRSDDDLSFPWKWKRAPQTPSVSGSSDISDASDVTVESNRTIQEQEKGTLHQDNESETERSDRWAQNRYNLIPSLAGGNMTGRHKISSWLDESKQDKLPVFEVLQKDKNDFAEQMPESRTQAIFRSPGSTPQFDFNTENRSDCKPKKQFLSCRDPSPCRSPNNDAALSTLTLKKPTSSPRSPFSPFSSLTPVSPFPSADVTDDNVFYSPKLQRRRESSSSCEPREGISLVDQRRSRTFTGPPSVGPGQDQELLDSQSSYADLKYGIEPGRSFSVSSVLSSRPSGPGRISTGTRFMSVGDLSKSALTCGSYDDDLDQWSITNDWTTKGNYPPTSDHRVSSVPSKVRSRSLPRSLTKCFANWSSEVGAPPPLTTTTTKSDHHRRPNIDISHFVSDTEGPPTPPPTPPLSPVSRRMSRPPSLSSPTSPSSPGAPQDSQSTRGLLPSRGYVSSLSTFEESSDSSSDTTTDDEYYLEIDDGEGKETEL